MHSGISESSANLANQTDIYDLFMDPGLDKEKKQRNSCSSPVKRAKRRYFSGTHGTSRSAVRSVVKFGRPVIHREFIFVHAGKTSD